MGQRTAADEDLAQKISSARQMPTDAAVLFLQKEYESAKTQGRQEHVWICLSELRMLLEYAGRRRPSLKVAILLVREYTGAASYNWLAHSLERYGWLRFARHFFERSLQAPDGDAHSIDWHGRALAGIARIDDIVNSRNQR